MSLDYSQEEFDENILDKYSDAFKQSLIDDFLEINDYLPINYFDSKHNEYREYLVNSYLTNKKLGNSEFSLIAYHMLFMSYMYKIFWQYYNFSFKDAKIYAKTILDFKDDDILKGFLNNKYSKLNSYANCYDINLLGETTVIELISHLHGIDKNALGKYMGYRNNSAHPNGKVFYNNSVVGSHVSEMFNWVKDIEEEKNKLFLLKLNLSKLNLDNDLENFLKNSLFSINELNYLYKNKGCFRSFNNKIFVVKIFLYVDYQKIDLEDFSYKSLFEWLMNNYKGTFYDIYEDHFYEYIDHLSNYEQKSIFEAINQSKILVKDKKRIKKLLVTK